MERMADSSDRAGTPAPKPGPHREGERAQLDRQEPALTVAAVARRLGVAPATLRTWDRRYGLGPSAHTPGAHRRYTAQDVTRLQVMRQFTVEGVAPADAAHLALTAPESASPDSASRLATVLPLPTPPVPPRTWPTHQTGGGRVVAMPGGTPEARGLARAALALDSYACAAIVEAALERDGVVTTWERLMVPVLSAVGERWAATGEGVEVEHLLAEVVTGSLGRVAGRLISRHDRGGPQRPGHERAATAGVWRNGRPVLLACAADELHVLPMHAVAAALAERDVASRVLGARTPVAALRSAVERSGPIAVMLWSQTARSADGEQFHGLASTRLAPLLIAAGPGWNEATLPPGVHVAHSFPRALTLVELALTGLRP